MIIIIDGYNLLKFIYKKKYIDEVQLQEFIKDLNLYVQRKKHYIVLVLDGGMSSRSTVERMNWGELVFSGTSQTADSYIKKYLGQFTNSDEVVVVSADREICIFAERFNIISIKPKLFYQKLKNPKDMSYSFKKTLGKANKLHNYEEETELDLLMQEGSTVLCYKDEKDIDKYNHLEQHESIGKKEKKINVLIKRL